MLQSLIEIQQQLLTGIVTLNLPERKTGVLTQQAESVLSGLKALQLKADNRQQTTDNSKQPPAAPLAVSRKPSAKKKK